MPQQYRRSLARQLADAPTIAEIRTELGQFSRLSIVEAAAACASRVPPVLIGRVIREASAVADEQRRTMTPEHFTRVARRLQNVADIESFQTIGSARVHDVALTRVMADSLPFNSRPHLSIHRAIAVLVDPVGPSLLDDDHWNARLGAPFKSLLLGSMYFHNRQPGTFDLAEFRREPMSADARTIITAAMTNLACPLDELTYAPRNGSDDPYQLGPLATTPLIQVDADRIIIPSPAHVPLATSLPALYIRLIREDTAEHSRKRSELAGHRFGQYLLDYARATLAPDAWEIRDLDSEPQPGGELADIAIWPADRSFMVVLEAKASLSSVTAMLGDPAQRERARRLYQKAFDQISNTANSRGHRSFLADAPTGVPVYGFTVTVDLHLTSVLDNATYFGIVLDYRAPGDQGATCEAATGRVISSDNAEMLLDVLALTTAPEAHDLLRLIAAKPTPLTAVPAAIEESGLGDRLADAPINRHVATTLAGLTDGLTDPVLRRWPQEILLAES